MGYRVEFAFAENFSAVSEWDTMDEWVQVSAENAEQAAMDAANADGFENALFRVYELTKNEFGKMEKADPHNPQYFTFGGME